MTITDTIREELTNIGYPHQPVKTGQIRSISGKVYRTLESKQIDDVLAACEALLEVRDWAFGVIAYDWAFRVRKQYTTDTFKRFESWLVKYVEGWGDCDDFCTHAFGALLAQHNELFDDILPWIKHDNFAMRRAAAVVLIYPINKGAYSGLNPLAVADLLLDDDHHLVQKGYGWMLKVLSQKEPETVISYLKQKHDRMPRTAFRYAIEKLAQDERKALMSL